jgi:hypothetical protein
MNSLWDIRIFLGRVPEESSRISQFPVFNTILPAVWNCKVAKITTDRADFLTARPGSG